MGKNKKAKSHLATTLVVVAVVLACIAAVYLWLFAGRASSNALIKIPVNATALQLHDSVAKYLGDGYAGKVTRLAKMRRTDLSTRHGAYMIEEGASPLTAMRRLTGGQQYPLKLTINGFRLPSVLQQRIAAKFDFTPDSIAMAMTDTAVLKKYGLSPEQSMSLFLNDSYDFYWNVSPESVINKIGNHYLDVWNQERRDKAAALGMTPAEVMTIASIVDEETNALEEKGAIGRLYINRLKIGMPLQSDPTVRYAGGDFSVKRITSKMTKIDSPYNTYMYRGLPPGPIRTTSVETIDAVLNNGDHDYIYMCAREDFSGRHNFAKTYAEHEANARRYKRELDRRGIF